MGLVRISLACFQLERDNECLLHPFLLTGNLNGRVNIALEAIHGGPYVFLDLEQLVDAQAKLGIVTILDDRFRLLAS